MTYALQRRVFCGIALAALLPAHAQVAGLGDAINKAGRGTPVLVFRCSPDGLAARSFR